MQDSNELLIPLLPPLLALLGHAADARARGDADVHALWLAAAGQN